MAQKLLYQVRLEAAMDPPPTITLATEEATADQEEAAPTAPATAEQAKPEEIPRLIYPFLQRFAQSAADVVAGPATSSAHPPPSEKPAESSISADNPPSSAANLATKRRSTAEASPEVRDEFRASRAEFIRDRSRMQAAGEALDDFFLEYLQEGPELAGEYPKRIADKSAAQAAYRAEHDRRAYVRAPAHAVELARAQLAGFQRSTASRSAALQRQLEEADENRWQTQTGSPGEAGDRAPLRKRCPVCGLEGTTGRGRESPNRSAHGAIMARKADENQR